jgi:hypothetical protein
MLATLVVEKINCTTRLDCPYRIRPFEALTTLEPQISFSCDMDIISTLVVQYTIFKLTKNFCFNVKETELRAIVDSVIIIFKILNQNIVAMCIMGCRRKKFRSAPLGNNPV